MDLVLPLSDSSSNNDLELRYCLRSFQRYLSGINNIFVIGHKPTWLLNVTHIPVNELTGDQYKDMNIFKKIKLACLDTRISEDFLFINDDHFLLSKFKADKFPYHYHSTLEQSISIRSNIDPYRRALVNTTNALLDRGAKTLLDFDTHCPIIYNKGLFLQTVNTMDWKRPWGYAIKSIYANLTGIKGAYYEDCKFRRPTNKQDIEQQINGRQYFSTHNRAINNDIIDVMNSLYPTPSKYEQWSI